MKTMYAKYCIPHDMSPDDVSWFQLTFSTRAELEIMNPYMSVHTIGGKVIVGGRKDTNACFHFDDDVLIFLIKFPNALLLEYNEMHNDY